MTSKEEYLIKLVDEIARKKLQGKDLVISILGEDQGNGYFGDIKKVKVRGTNSSLEMVVKVSVRTDEARAVIPVDEAYNNELLFYKDIFFEMDKLQKELGIRNIFNSVPEYYECGEFEDQSYIAMEDLAASGFEMFDLRKEVNEEHVEIICRLFGRFHALSFAFKHLKPELYESLVNELQSVHLGFLRYKGGFLTQCASVIQSGLDGKGWRSEIVDYYVENIEKTYRNLLLASGRDQYSCIIHYDGWINNFMFKYSDSKGIKIPTDVKLFDWQTCSVGTPAVDLSIALYSIASRTVLDNLDKYLKIYHEALQDSLSHAGLEVENVYPFRVLKEQWRKYGEYGVIRGLLVHKIRLNLGEETQSFEDAMNAEFDVEEMRKLLDGLLVHLESIGVF